MGLESDQNRFGRSDTTTTNEVWSVLNNENTVLHD